MQTIKIDDEELELVPESYFNDRVAITLYMKLGGRYGVLTVNLPDEKLEHNEFFVKTWSENQTLAKACRESKLFIDTGKRVKTGHVIAEVWKLAEGVEL